MEEPKHSLDEVYRQLITRDGEDEEIAKVIKSQLTENGLKLFKAKRFTRLDTSEIVGVDNVVNHLLAEIRDDDRIIAIEGLSGVGKGTTAHALKKELNGLVISFGEIFRYLAFMKNVHGEKDYAACLANIRHELEDGDLHLFLDNENISQKLHQHLQDPFLSSQVPKVASETQDVVINFVVKEIERVLNVYNSKIIFEGRNYTLDFLPCDLRIELFAHPLIRAKRRFNQQQESVSEHHNNSRKDDA